MQLHVRALFISVISFSCSDQISGDTVQVDWSHTFIDSHRTYHHFEWAIGSEKGKSDISEFQNVGLSGIVQVNGLDLRGLDACYVTLRAWKTDGDSTEFYVKAQTLKGQQCIHRRLLVGDGIVTITEGESIRDFFKHAEEVVKEVTKFCQACYISDSCVKTDLFLLIL